ncbi:MAG: sodium:calcium antiporter [Candidatus Geothermarchaeales archaeon]
MSGELLELLGIIWQFTLMTAWILVLVLASFLLSLGAEMLSHFLGGKFVGRTLLSITTTLPEIMIVVYASRLAFYGTSLGSALGSNVLMMSLGLSVMVLIATTPLSKMPVREINVEGFKLDMAFLIITAILGVIMFIDGYDLIDGVIFLAMFITYLVFAFHESRGERMFHMSAQRPLKGLSTLLKSIALFVLGAIGILVGAEPFVHSLEGVAAEIGTPAAVVAVILSPLAGEMPEKISMMFLARKGGEAVSISVANVLGSKVLNNTLLLSCMILGAVYFHGLDTLINPNGLLMFEVYWAGVMTILATSLMFDRKLTLSDGVSLTILYLASVGIQFLVLMLL